ncbi:DUF485 domain-containing protein [Streptomyces sp. NPDC001700]
MTKAVRPPAPISSERATGHGFAGRGNENGEPDFAAIQESPEFDRLRKRLRRFIFPMSALFFCWYMTFALFSAYGHGFMSRKVFGSVNMGTAFGLLQFVSTMAIVLLYRGFADRKIDPQVDKVRELAGADKE